MLLVMELEEGGVALRRSGRARRMTTLRRRVLEVKTGVKEMYASIARSAVIAGESAINGLRTGPHLHGPISKEAKGVGELSELVERRMRRRKAAKWVSGGPVSSSL
ncbi:hypothetical protein CLOM_g21251 [Closterium sp. NIES-68]|nr:hypothetical protein CLOM_g21251 [Closterium sp. NIES-68]GJP70555.1 hypothetical protein CLOP_g1481 [Closterium sp. NIES-67]